ncbi:hypothetical protein N431DRAFT_466568 [Stipitochalara longipes BDJ]|nr:hypothetical protein N431DRAFT_466568 [Stipitochalara longipes BDJ]
MKPIWKHYLDSFGNSNIVWGEDERYLWNHTDWNRLEKRYLEGMSKEEFCLYEIYTRYTKSVHIISIIMNQLFVNRPNEMGLEEELYSQADSSACSDPAHLGYVSGASDTGSEADANDTDSSLNDDSDATMTDEKDSSPISQRCSCCEYCPDRSKILSCPFANLKDGEREEIMMVFV